MQHHKASSFAVLGAGAFGTALTLHLARRGHKVFLWSVVPEEIEEMKKNRCNQRFLPGFDFPESIIPTNDIAVVATVENVLIAVPSVGYSTTLEKIQPHFKSDCDLISATKGLEENTGRLLNAVIEEKLGKDQSYAILSGPSFAREVAQGNLTAIVVASHDQALAERVAEKFKSPNFRTHVTNDVVGVEIGGVSKNVIAIATGIVDGLSLGANARCALITEGLQEIAALGISLGAELRTFLGLACMGDLILTALDDQSRNRRFGLAIGRGKDFKTAEHEIGHAIEGKRNAQYLLQLANQHQVDMPICRSVLDVITGKIKVEAFLKQVF